jgi:hypothetical protein
MDTSFEMEIHGPVTTANSGQSFSLEEKQALFAVKRWHETEEDLRRLLGSLLTGAS